MYDKVPVYAAQASFFIFISIFPFIILLMSLVKYTPLPETVLLDLINTYMPNVIGTTVSSWIREIYRSNTYILSASIILALWAASKGFLGLCTSINDIYRASFAKNYLIKRVFALLYTVILIMTLVLTAVFIVFGDRLISQLRQSGDLSTKIAGYIGHYRIIVILSMLFLFFLILFRFIPYNNSSFKKSLPGALFTTGGWFLFSIIYSIYVNHVNMSTSIYGSLTTVVLMMLWLYFCMYILLLGAELNVSIYGDRSDRRKW